MSDQLKDALQFVHEIGERSFEVLHGVGVNTDFNAPVIIKSGQVQGDLERFLRAPARTRNHQQVTDCEGFVSYLERFGALDRLAFASMSSQTVRAAIDATEEDDPRWEDHTVTLVSVKTPEWLAVEQIAGKQLSQEQFADWLEEHTHIVTDPEAAELLEVALNLQGSVGGKFAARINRSNGSAVFSYEQETTTNQVRVPTRIYVSLRPFEYAALTTVEIHLRFRIVDGRPVFTMVVPKAAKVMRDAFETMLESLRSERPTIVRVP